MMDREQLDAILSRHAASTHGPWEAIGDSAERPPMVWDGSGDSIVDRMPDGRPYFEPEDAAFIAAAHQDIPALVAEVLAWRRKYANLIIMANADGRALGRSLPHNCAEVREAREILAEEKRTKP